MSFHDLINLTSILFYSKIAKAQETSPSKKVVLNRNINIVTSPSLQEENSNPLESLKEKGDSEDKEKKIVKLGSLTAEERAKLRAQKFGVPVPEEIKKSERAERFGIQSGQKTAKNKPATITTVPRVLFVCYYLLLSH